MKLSSMRILLASLGIGLIGACGQATSGEMLGGETHWLRECTGRGAEECGPNLDCVCGVCTSACSVDASCAGLGGSAACRARETTEYAAACESRAPERLCVRGASEEPGGADTPVDGSRMPIQGMRYDAVRNCLEPMAVAGFATSSAGGLTCDDALSYGLTDDECWRFPSSCLPDGFRRGNLAVEDNFCFAAPACEPLSCDANQVPTVVGCLTCDAANRAQADDIVDLFRASEFDACDADIDCTSVSWETSCDAVCPVAVNATLQEPFQSQATAVSAYYCVDPNRWFTTCGIRDIDCRTASLCRDGRCVMTGTTCADRTLDACELNGDCVIGQAFAYAPEGQCFSADSVDVACVDPDASCRPVVTPGVDSNGDCYLFGGCLPPGFEPAPDGSECVAAVGTTCG